MFNRSDEMPCVPDAANDMNPCIPLAEFAFGGEQTTNQEKGREVGGHWIGVLSIIEGPSRNWKIETITAHPSHIHIILSDDIDS